MDKQYYLSQLGYSLTWLSPWSGGSLPCWKVNLQIKYMGSIIVLILFKNKLKLKSPWMLIRFWLNYVFKCPLTSCECIDSYWKVRRVQWHLMHPFWNLLSLLLRVPGICSLQNSLLEPRKRDSIFSGLTNFILF